MIYRLLKDQDGKHFKLFLLSSIASDNLVCVVEILFVNYQKFTKHRSSARSVKTEKH